MKTIGLLFLLLVPAYSDILDYYWRDYTGEIPDDALSGGKDKNNQTTYIAQVFIPKQGVLPGRLYKGQTSVTTSKQGVHTSGVFVKVLCSNHPEKLSWISTTATKLHTDAIGKHLVNGGTENGKYLNIGRTSYEGELVVGKVCGYNIGNALMYFPYGQKEWATTSYEVLVYEDNSVGGVDPRISISSE